MNANQIIEVMNASIAVVCAQVAEDRSLDASELYSACALVDTQSTSQFYSYANKNWDIELYFYYPDQDVPDLQTPASHWCMAVSGTDERSNLLRSVAFSATITLLKQMDPELDDETVITFLMLREPLSQYIGNGYRLTYLTTEDGDDTQVMVELT